MSDPVSFTGQRGAGSYRDAVPAAARCKRGNNPYGHNPECDCQDDDE